MLGYRDASAPSITSPYPSSDPSQPSSENIPCDTNKNYLPPSDIGPQNTSGALITDEKHCHKSKLNKISLHDLAAENNLE